MRLFELFGAGVVLLTMVGVGTVFHELSHATALRAIGVDCEIEWIPGADESGLLGASVSGALATVTPRAIPRGLPPWRLRAAAISPLVLATPLALALTGALPDPFSVANVYFHAAVIGWIACALPSPRDFSLFWHAKRVITDHATEAGCRRARSPSDESRRT